VKPLDWITLLLFFGALVAIGAWAFRRVRQSGDFYLAGGRLPWWVSGVSHHVSGYSGVVFTGYAAIAYTHGFTIYVWWALGIFASLVLGAFTIAPRWVAVRRRLSVQSPTEYLAKRYNLPTQQLVAWIGIVLKLLDSAAKWVAIGILLNGFTGLPLAWGILISGCIAMIYVTAGGLWADTVNDFVQFLIQVAAGIAMLVVVMRELGGAERIFTMWGNLPAANGSWFRDPYTAGFALSFLVVLFMSYNGGTWNLAARFLAVPDARQARKTALLSAVLYLVWPLVLFLPMWAAPLLLPDLAEPEKLYSVMAVRYLPAGLVGLVLASMFAATMSMTASDANTISAVFARDVLPVFTPRARKADDTTPLWLARTVTFCFLTGSVIIALNNHHFGGILGLVIRWFGGLIGPASIPMILGLLPWWKQCGPAAACSSIVAGVATFAIVNLVLTEPSYAVSVSSPVLVALAVFTIIGWSRRFSGKQVPGEVEQLMTSPDDSRTP
jgi:SSS family solute:Na+ symporter